MAALCLLGWLCWLLVALGFVFALASVVLVYFFRLLSFGVPVAAGWLFVWLPLRLICVFGYFLWVV